MRAARGVSVGVALAVFEQFLGREPVVHLDALETAAVYPEVIGLPLNFGLGGLVDGGRKRGGFHGVALVRVYSNSLAAPGRSGSAPVGEGCAYLAVVAWVS